MMDGVPSAEAYGKTLLGQFDQLALSKPVARVIFVVLVIGILVVASVQSIHSINEIDKSLYREGGERHKTALGRWLPTAGVLADQQSKENPYGPGHWFPTPPLVLISLVPLWKLGYTGAAIVWTVLKVAGFTLAMAWLIREFGRGGFTVPLGVMLIAAVFSLRPIISDIQHGNLNIFMMVWLALAWALYMRGHDFWAGLFVALAIVTKLTPALALLYFAYKRAWRVCIGVAVGLVLFFFVLPAICLGWDRNLELLQSWFNMLVAPFALHGYVATEIANQSLHGVIVRVLSYTGLLAVEPMTLEQAMEAGMEAMARPAKIEGMLIRPVISLAVVGSLGWLCRSRCASRRDPRMLLEFGLILLAMLLLSERTWKHHATTLPIVFLGVWYVVACCPWAARTREWWVTGLIAQLVLLLGTSEGIWGDRLAEVLLGAGAFCLGLVICFVQTGAMLRALNRQANEPARAA
jgi:alpha-1,2-mannosyltransferase